MISSIGGSPSYEYGAIVDLPDVIARAWLAERIAEPIAPEAEEAVAVDGVETRPARGRKRR